MIQEHKRRRWATPPGRSCRVMENERERMPLTRPDSGHSMPYRGC
jgi:hypothetical protein